MSSTRSCFNRQRFLAILLVLPWLVLSCGEGWDAYRDEYNTGPGQAPGQPWVGDETVFVRLGPDESDPTIETPLQGIITSDLDGIGAVRLSDLIEVSQISTRPDLFRYNFIATDGYDLLRKKLGDDIEKLPNWENMQNGFLYSPTADDLTTAWRNHPWGSAITAYNVKFMNGGLIELLTP